MAWWLVTDFDRSTDLVSAAWVEADDEQRAAELGADRLQAEWESKDVGCDIDTVFVVAAEGRVAYVIEFEARAGVAELQCCGGIGGGRHAATCPTAPEDEKGILA